jgi:gliding motility-associated-like protein
MSDKNINKFDELLKSKLDAHSVPFDSSNWDKLQKQLPKNTPKPFYKNPWLMSGAAAVLVVAVSVSAYYYNSNNTTESLNTTPVEISENSKQENTKVNSEKSNNETNLSNEIEKTTELTENTTPINNDSNENTEISSVESNITDSKIDNKKETETIASTNHMAENNKKEDKNNLQETPDDLSHTVTSEIIPESFFPKPLAIFSSDYKEVCLGNVVNFTSEKQNDVIYLWSFGDDNYSEEQNPSHKYLKPGEYIVKLIVKSTIDQNLISQSEDYLVKVYELPSVSFDFEHFVENGKPYTKFTNSTQKATSSIWNFKDGKASDEKNPVHFFKRKGTYGVSLSIVDENGCKATKTRDIYIEDDYNLLAPNSFTPNGDGLNDVFIPEALKIMNVDFTMRIFNQTNGLVYETKNLSMPWDGTNSQTGERCLEGNYFWVVTLINENGEAEQYKGNVLILNK